jgi:hypothetical protein
VGPSTHWCWYLNDGSNEQQRTGLQKKGVEQQVNCRTCHQSCGWWWLAFSSDGIGRWLRQWCLHSLSWILLGFSFDCFVYKASTGLKRWPEINKWVILGDKIDFFVYKASTGL